MKKNTLYCFQFFCLLIFILYWTYTLLYCSPSNYIRIKAATSIQVFETFFYQKWGFFAPPPQSNDRLYYVFSDAATKKEKLYEALVPILQKKQQNAPFNSKEEAIDYILSGSITTISDEIRDLMEISKTSMPDSSTLYHLLKAHNIINKLGTKYIAIQTLYNYGLTIAKKEDIHPDSMKIIIAQIPIPKFKDRYQLLDSAYKVKEQILFATNYLPLK